MIRPFPRIDPATRRHARLQAAHEWRRVFVPFAILNVEGRGRCVVVMQTLETRRSQRRACRLWQVPA